MTMYQQPALVLPPAKPPKQISTVGLSIVSVILSIFVCGVVKGSYTFPGNAPVEILIAGVTAMLLWGGALYCSIVALVQELFRKRYAETVHNYAHVTGDQRYLPYIVPTSLPLVMTLSIIGMALPFVSFLLPLFNLS